MTKEQNDAREVLRIAVGRVVRDVANFPQAVQTRLLGQDMTHLRDALVDSVADSGFFRAAVPDAATEELRADELTAEEAVKLVLKRPGMYGLTRTDEFRKVEAERDAALAAVERVRAIAERHGVKSWTEEIFAALDGAPEPEREYGFELIEPDDRNVFEREGDFISAAFAYRAAKKRIDEEHQADLPRLQYLIVRRRKAGPWLPVEGERK